MIMRPLFSPSFTHRFHDHEYSDEGDQDSELTVINVPGLK